MNNLFSPGPAPNTVRAPDGRVLTVPEGWILLPPGDAALTRRVKAAGDHWVVQEKKGRKIFSRGVWASAATIERIRADLEAERATEGYARKKEAGTRRRDKAQAEYVEDFHGAVLTYLAFHEKFTDLAEGLARAVTSHATPVGSGTVARTKRIAIEERAEAAVMSYDDGRQIWADLNSSSAIQLRYMRTERVLQLPARVSGGGAVAWLLTDRMGSLRNVVNPT